MRSTTRVQPAEDSAVPGAIPRAVHPEFSERTLAELLAALRLRTTGHPDNPGLIACWPRVRQERMAAACAELQRRGHPVYRVPIEGGAPGATREGWAVAGPTDELISRP